MVYIALAAGARRDHHANNGVATPRCGYLHVDATLVLECLLFVNPSVTSLLLSLESIKIMRGEPKASEYRERPRQAFLPFRNLMCSKCILI